MEAEDKFWVVRPLLAETGVAGPFTKTEALDYIEDTGGGILVTEVEPAE